ncbi:MAG TPA: hypothetical protein VFI08_08035 [Spirochaetia bacterium]|nr:hypothetical protein [Spirochaetia bacterium]
MVYAWNAAASFIGALPPGLRAVLVLVGGWLAAFFLRFLLTWLLDLVRFNTGSDRLGISEFLRKGQVTHRPSKLAGVLAYWTVLLVTLLQASRILDIRVVTSFSDRLRDIVPGLLAAVFIGIIGLVVVSFIGNFVMTVARTAGFTYAALLARVVKIAGGILVVGIAVQQIDINQTMISSLLQILFAAVVFALALAFGLGCKDIAREAATRLLQNLRERRRTDGRPDLEG